MSTRNPDWTAMRVLRGIAGGIVVLAALAGAAVGADVWEDRQHRIEITHPTPLRRDSWEFPGNPVLVTLAPSEAVRVRRIRYGKDYIAVRVRTRAGVEGYLFFGDTTWNYVDAE